MIELDALQAAAEAATPGEWFWTESLEKGEASLDVAGSDQFVLSASGLHTEGFLSVDEADAAFIAAANPAVVLELITEHRAALARIARVEALHRPDTIMVGMCAECSDFGTDEHPEWRGFEYPCATVRALTEGESDG